MKITDKLSNQLRITRLKADLSKLETGTPEHASLSEFINLLIIQDKYDRASSEAFNIICKNQIPFNPQNKDALTTALAHYKTILKELKALRSKITT